MTKMNGDATQRDRHQKISIDNLANDGIDKKVKRQTTRYDDEAKNSKISREFVNDNREHSKASTYSKDGVDDRTDDNIQLDINENDYSKKHEGEEHEKTKDSIILNGVISKCNEMIVTGQSAIINTVLQKALTESALGKVVAGDEMGAGISNFIGPTESATGDDTRSRKLYLRLQFLDREPSTLVQYKSGIAGVDDDDSQM